MLEQQVTATSPAKACRPYRLQLQRPDNPAVWSAPSACAQRQAEEHAGGAGQTHCHHFHPDAAPLPGGIRLRIKVAKDFREARRTRRATVGWVPPAWRAAARFGSKLPHYHPLSRGTG